MGGTASIVLNAANEIAVAAFLENKIAFTDIAQLIEQTLSQATISEDVSSLALILEADARARTITNKNIAAMQS